MDEIKRIFKLKKYIILGQSPPELIQEIFTVYRILRTAALKQETRNWLKPSSPPYQECKETVQEIVEIERIMFQFRNKEIEFNRRLNKRKIVRLYD